MNTYNYALGLTLIISALYLKRVSGQEETMCRGQALNMTKEQKGQITDCLDEAGIGSVWKIPADKLSCFGVCVMEKKSMLTPEGKINHEKILNYINDVMKPDDVKDILVKGTDQCIKDHGEKVKVINDPKCLTYMEVGQCIHNVFLDICVED